MCHLISDNSTSETSSWGRMTGKRPDTKYDYGHEFDAYVQYRKNDTSKSTTIPQTHGGLVSYPCGGGS